MIFLETQRLILRNVQPSDAEVMHDYRNNEICARYQRGQTKDLEGIRDLVIRRGADVLGTEENCLVAVELKATGKCKVLADPKKYAPSGVYIMRIHGTFVNFLDLSPEIQQDIIKRLDPASTTM